jgi:hypothetical protein
LLIENHKYSLTELEHMIPWEREAFISLLLQQMEEKTKEAEKANV